MAESFSFAKQAWYIEDTHIMLGYIGNKIANTDRAIVSRLYEVLEDAEKHLKKMVKS
jgi:hypothetical protein